jgi:hypothetical protein
MRLSQLCHLETCDQPHQYQSYMKGPARFNFCSEEHLVQHIRLRAHQFNRVCVEAYYGGGSHASQTRPQMVEA